MPRSTPRTTEIPRDGRPPGIDELRSIACVGVVMSRAEFTPVLGDLLNDARTLGAIGRREEALARCEEYRLAQSQIQNEIPERSRWNGG